MTETRRKTLDLIRAMLADCAADKSLPIGTRERLAVMSGRIATEIECIEGIASSASFRPSTDEEEMPTDVKARCDAEARDELQKLRARQRAVPTVADAGAERKHVERAPSRCGSYLNHKWAGGFNCWRCGAKRESLAAHAKVTLSGARGKCSNAVLGEEELTKQE